MHVCFTAGNSLPQPVVSTECVALNDFDLFWKKTRNIFAAAFILFLSNMYPRSAFMINTKHVYIYIYIKNMSAHHLHTMNIFFHLNTVCTVWCKWCKIYHSITVPLPFHWLALICASLSSSYSAFIIHSCLCQIHLIEILVMRIYQCLFESSNKSRCFLCSVFSAVHRL